MIPVLTPEEMATVDESAAEAVETLIERAGFQVARVALQMMGGAYGRRVVVVAGVGHNGDDGRAAAAHLRRRGVQATVIDAGGQPGATLATPVDLVIDAAYGTGLRRPYAPPDTGGAPVLAVDIPSGLSGLTGEVLAGARGAGDPAGAAGSPVYGVQAAATVTFAALKPGLLLGEGPERCGTVEVADIGLDAEVDRAANTWLVTDDDVIRLLPGRPHDAHKWQSALQVVAGSPGMTGAPWLVAQAALRTGAGYVRLGLPGMDPAAAGLPPGEVVSHSLPADGWAEALGEVLTRCRALVVGPGLGPVAGAGGETHSAVARLVAASPIPVLIDADGIRAVGGVEQLAALARRRDHPTVITPHAGEYLRLTGSPPPADRVGAVRDLALRTGAVVLLKGSTTVIGGADGRVLLVTSGSARLATAGTGDVLSGVIGALLARGVPAWEAAGIGAHIHGRAAGRGRAEGLVASDLPELVSAWLSEIRP